MQITCANINQIRLREPLEIQTIHPKKYLKLTNELGYDGHMLPILINYKVVCYTALPGWNGYDGHMLPILINYKVVCYTALPGWNGYDGHMLPILINYKVVWP